MSRIYLWRKTYLQDEIGNTQRTYQHFCQRALLFRKVLVVHQTHGLHIQQAHTLPWNYTLRPRVLNILTLVVSQYTHFVNKIMIMMILSNICITFCKFQVYLFRHNRMESEKPKVKTPRWRRWGKRKSPNPCGRFFHQAVLWFHSTDFLVLASPVFIYLS